MSRDQLYSERIFGGSGGKPHMRRNPFGDGHNGKEADKVRDDVKGRGDESKKMHTAGRTGKVLS